MATVPTNLLQAQAAYNTVFKQKQGVLRGDEVRRNRALLGVDNYLKQQGIGGGHAESIKLKANGMRSDTTDFDNQLINLAAIIQGFNSSRGRGRTSAMPNYINNAVQRSIGAMNTASRLPTAGHTGHSGYGNNNFRYYTKQVM